MLQTSKTTGHNEENEVLESDARAATTSEKASNCYNFVELYVSFT